MSVVNVMSNAGVWGCGIYAITSPSGGMYVGSAAQAGRGPSPATIEKARLANTGRSLSPEHAAKARVAALGSKKSQESIARSSAAAKTFCENNRQLVLDRVRAVHCGRKRSDETRRRISEARRASHARKAAGNGG